MSKWIDSKVRLPKQGQWVVVVWGDSFKAGRFDAKHPFSPIVMDRATGRYWSGFKHWKPLSAPKGSV